MRILVAVLAVVVCTGCNAVADALGLLPGVELTFTNRSAYNIVVLREEGRPVSHVLPPNGGADLVRIESNEFKADRFTLTARIADELPPGCSGGEDTRTFSFPREDWRAYDWEIRLSDVECESLPESVDSVVVLTLRNTSADTVKVTNGSSLLTALTGENTSALAPNASLVVVFDARDFPGPEVHVTAATLVPHEGCTGGIDDYDLRFRQGTTDAEWDIRISSLRCP